MAEPIHVAVIGGGCAAMAAAFELSRPEHRGRYRITVYQQGWRLGGKGASGRGPAGRIEEHGLHVWMGWYENAFRLMRECYAELAATAAGPGAPPMHWRDAFIPDPYIGVADRDRRGGWSSLLASMPQRPGSPGDPLTAGPFTISNYLGCAVELLIAGLRDLHIYLHHGLHHGPHHEPAHDPHPDRYQAAAPSGAASSRGAASLPGAASPLAADPPIRSLGQQIDALISFGRLASLAGLAEAGDILRRFFTRPAEHPPGPLISLLDRLTATARSWIDALATSSDEIRRRWYMVDLVLAALRGMIRDRIALDPRGFDAINHHDFRDWLRLHGASELTLASDHLRGGLYDLSFAYVDGDPTKPAFGAGDAMRCACRMFFTYRGAFFWKLRGGMGDVVFAPLYEVLRRRGVEFRFFHRLDNVQLAPDGSHVAALEMSVQAETRDGDYRPLVDVAGMPCWPAEPDFDQLVDGDALRTSGWQPESFWEPRRAGTRTLRVRDDFDLVVLGVGLGAIPHVCRELVARDPRWRAMTERVATIATQAFQLWLRADLAELGWPGPSPSLSGFAKPFDTWADMPHLIDAEAWRDPPRSIAYFCGALALPPGTPGDPQHPAAQHARVRDAAIGFLDRHIHPLWPRAVRPGGGFRWELLADARADAGIATQAAHPSGASGPSGPSGPAGPERFATQYWTANVNPSDRYVQSLPGSAVYRISPLDASYDNLTIAGDWTACGINVGCVEAAVMSGRLAAHAIAQSPPLADIIGYDHP
jgi:uncharacterized protein with NAD-binding domain and iron-sulfur cluster